MVRNSREDLELRLEILTEIHDRSNIAAAVTVVGGGPDRHDILVFEMVLVAFVDQLMRSCNQLEAVDVVELGQI